MYNLAIALDGALTGQNGTFPGGWVVGGRWVGGGWQVGGWWVALLEIGIIMQSPAQLGLSFNWGYAWAELGEIVLELEILDG